MLDLLVVGQRHRLPGCVGPQPEPRRLVGFQRFAGQPTQRQRRRLAVFLAAHRHVGGAEELEQHLENRPVDEGGARQVGGAEPVDPGVVRPVQTLPRLKAGGAADHAQQPAADQPPQGRRAPTAALSSRQQADGRAQQRQRQSIRGGLEIVQIDEVRPVVLAGPAAESRKEMALADAGLAPQDHPDAATRRQRLAGQVGQPGEGGLVNVGHVHVGRPTGC